MKSTFFIKFLQLSLYMLICLCQLAIANSPGSQDSSLNYSFVSPFGPYEFNYLFPISVNSSRMNYDQPLPTTRNLNYEVKFQISGQTDLFKNLFHKPLNLNMFYTQVSYWQFYAPTAYFRETNYNPGVFFHFEPTTSHLPLKISSIDLGAMHQSNGMGGTNERSWNRIYWIFTFTLSNNWTLAVRPWYRVHMLEDQDYNPNITKYLGDGDMRLSYVQKNFIFSLLLRNEIESGFSRGAEELDIAFPFFHHIHGFVQAFSGYGQSLISYNHYTNSIGAGFSLMGNGHSNI